jgi:hypothetical protein
MILNNWEHDRQPEMLIKLGAQWSAGDRLATQEMGPYSLTLCTAYSGTFVSSDAYFCRSVFCSYLSLNPRVWLSCGTGLAGILISSGLIHPTPNTMFSNGALAQHYLKTITMRESKGQYELFTGAFMSWLHQELTSHISGAMIDIGSRICSHSRRHVLQHPS